MTGRRGDSGGRSTIFDVAALAGVSIKTVSRVVNNEPNVRDQTRDKVTRAIAKLDYRPNAAARGLSSKRSYVIGLAYENPHEFGYLKDLLTGALEACEEQSYSLLLKPITLPDDALVDNIRRFAEQTRLDGMILPAPLCDDANVIRLMMDLEIPCARVAPKSPDRDAIDVVCNDEEASFALAEFVIAEGHQRIGFIKGHPDHGAAVRRFAGYKRALKAHGIAYSGSLVRQGYFDFESGRKAGLKLLSLADPPTAIIASNDDMAAGAIFQAHEAGLAVPEDVSVVGFDDTPIASHTWPPLTTVRQPITRMAKTAADLLIRKLRDRELEVELGALPCEMVVRRSTTRPSSG